MMEFTYDSNFKNCLSRYKIKNNSLFYNHNLKFDNENLYLYDSNSNKLDDNLDKSKSPKKLEKKDKKLYWFYHSNFIIEEELIKKAFCTWTPFYIDLNKLINECIKHNKEIIHLDNKYVLDLKNNYFYNLTDQNIRRYIYCIDLNSTENFNFPIKRIFRCAQNLRVNRLNLLENLNGMDISIDWYSEKYSKLDEKKKLKYKNSYEIQKILELECNKVKLDMNKKEFEDLLKPLDKKFRVNPYENYTKEIKLCEILKIQFDDNLFYLNKDNYEVSNINVFRNLKIPKFNNEIFYKELIIPYWIIDQINSFKSEFNKEHILRKEINFFEKNFKTIDDIIESLLEEFSNQFDLFIDYYKKNIENSSADILKNQNNFSMDFPKNQDISFSNKSFKLNYNNQGVDNYSIIQSNNSRNQNVFINFDSINKPNNNKNSFKNKEVFNAQYNTEKKRMIQSKKKKEECMIFNPKNKEKYIKLQKDLENLNKKKDEFKQFFDYENFNKNKEKLENLNNFKKKNILTEKNESMKKETNGTFGVISSLNNEDNIFSINKYSLIYKYQTQKEEYLKIIKEIKNENLAEKIIQLFTLEGEIFHIVNATLKNYDFYYCKIKLFILLLLSTITNISKSNTVNSIQKMNLLRIGKFPNNNNIYDFGKENQENSTYSNTNEYIHLNDNHDNYSLKNKIEINKYLSVLMINKPKLKLRLFRNFEPSIEFFKKIVYSYKYKKSKDFMETKINYKINNDAQLLYNNKTLYNSTTSENKDSKIINHPNYDNNNISVKFNRTQYEHQVKKGKNKNNNSSIKKELYSKENLLLSEHYKINIEKLGELKNIGKDNSGFSLINSDKYNFNDKITNLYKPFSAYHKAKNERKTNTIKFNKEEFLFNKYIRFDEIISAYYDEEKFLLENLLDSKAKFQMVIEYDFDEILKNNCSMAFIDQYSFFPSEKEVLISPHFIYKIKDIDFIELEKLSNLFFFAQY